MTKYYGKICYHMGATGPVVNVGRAYGRLLNAGTMACIAVLGVLVAGGLQTTSARAQSVPMRVDKPIKIVAFGDSLTAGYLLAPSEAFPVVLGRALVAKGYNVEMINAGVSGDTTAAAMDRIGWAVPADADAVILELGANDALRGLDPEAAERNLDTMIKGFQSQKVDILLAGMYAPRSMGEPYTTTFDTIFPKLAEQYGVLLYPFFLEKTALNPQLSLADGLHPNAKGVVAIVEGILPNVEDLIARVKARRLTAAKG